MIDKKYIDEFKKTKIYSLIKKSVEQQQIGKMLQGQGKYSMSFLPISTSTDTSLIITGLHILLSENIILNSDINNAFNKIVISKNNVCLLLDYIHSYLLYRNIDNLLDFKYQNLLKRIMVNGDDYQTLVCFKTLFFQISTIIGNDSI